MTVSHDSDVDDDVNEDDAGVAPAAKCGVCLTCPRDKLVIACVLSKPIKFGDLDDEKLDDYVEIPPRTTRRRRCLRGVESMTVSVEVTTPVVDADQEMKELESAASASNSTPRVDSASMEQPSSAVPATKLRSVAETTEAADG